MSADFSYGPGTYNLGRLSDEIVAGGVTLLTIRGDTANIVVVCADGTVQATVDALVAAHSGATPPLYVYPVLPGGTTTFVRADGTLSAVAGVLSGVEQEGRIFQSMLPKVAAGLPLVADKAYFVYLGKVAVALTPAFLEFHVVTAAVGAQTAEVGFFSTPAAPSKVNQTLTKIIATGTVDDLTTTGVKRNTSNFSTSVAAGTYLWAGIRTNMATDQPTLFALFGDMGQGHVLEKATAGALTSSSTFAGVIPTVATTATTPHLTGTLD